MLSQNNVATYGSLQMWAEAAKIHIVDTITGEKRVEGIREMLQRASGLSQLGRSLADDSERTWYRNEILTAVEDMIALCKIAKEQRERLVRDSVILHRAQGMN